MDLIADTSSLRYARLRVPAAGLFHGERWRWISALGGVAGRDLVSRECAEAAPEHPRGRSFSKEADEAEGPGDLSVRFWHAATLKCFACGAAFLGSIRITIRYKSPMWIGVRLSRPGGAWHPPARSTRGVL